MPDEPEAMGLLALLLLTHARRPARLDTDGELVPLDQQDRTRWDAGFIAEGQNLVRRCLRRNRPGSYQIQAAIAAVHSDAPSFAATDWDQVIALYDQLAIAAPSPVSRVARAVAIGERDGPKAGLAALDALAESPQLQEYAVHHAARAAMLARLERPREARAAYDRAIELTDNAPEQRALVRRRAAITQ